MAVRLCPSAHCGSSSLLRPSASLRTAEGQAVGYRFYVVKPRSDCQIRKTCGSSSVGRAFPCQGKGRGFESRLPLKIIVMLRSFQKLTSKIVYSNPWIKVFEDQVIRPDGTSGIYGYLDKEPGAFIMIWQGSKLGLIRNYRYPTNQYFWELPGGVAKVISGDDAPGFLREARRELREEVGIESQNLTKLGRVFLGVGHETTYVDIFTASLQEIDAPHLRNQEGDESIQGLKFFTFNNVLKMLSEGELQDSVLVSAIALYLTKMPKNDKLGRTRSKRR